MTDIITLTFTGTSFPYSGATEGIIGTDLSIDWGDGNSETIVSGIGLPSHTYSSNDIYTITITGTSITSIGELCFLQNSGLIGIVIPNSVTSIGNSCFRFCSNLMQVTFKSVIPPTMGKYVFSGVPVSCMIYVPKGRLNEYINASNYPSSNTYTYIEYEETSTWTISNKTVDSLFIDNKEVQSIIRTSDNVVLYSKSSASPVLITSTITLSANNISYGNNVILNGTLNSESGKSVKIYQNDTLIDTVSTTTNGAFTKTVSGLNVGTYTFKAVFDGDNTYSSVTSSNVSVTVSKATPTITLSTTNNNLTVGDTLSLNGTFSLGTGKSIKIYQNNTLIDTVTTTTNGAFAKSVTGLTSGSYTFKAIYEGNSNYNSVTSSDVSVTVTGQIATPNSISLVSNKYILSYVDNDSATLSATVLDSNDNGINGVTVTFYKGNTSIGTATTNSNGVATKTYTSTGDGKTSSISAEIDNLYSNSVLIEDCKYYKETISSTITPQVPLSSNCVVEFDILKKVNQSSNASATIYVGNNNTDYLGCGFGASNDSMMYFFERTSSVSIVQQSLSPYLTLNTDYHVKVVISGTTAIMVIGDNQYVLQDIGVAMSKLYKIDYNSNALISNVKVNDVIYDDIVLSASKSVLSYYENTDAFDDWTGTYATGTDKYYYLTPNNNLTFNGTLPSEFEFRYKFKTKTSTTSGTGCLWTIGTDANNGVLVGHEPTNRRMKLYTRSNGSNTSRYTQNYAFNYQEWTDVIVTYQDNEITITMNNNTMSYELSDASFLKIYDTYNQLELADFSITDLSTGNIVSDSSNESILSALVLDNDDSPVPNSIVSFDIDGFSEEIRATDENGIAYSNYVSQEYGDVTIKAETSNAEDTLVLEDCQYYNKGDTLYGLTVDSNVSCTSDGEWIEITTSTSGEKYVRPPVCYTGSDNWELDFYCDPSNYTGQAFGVQIHNCSSGSYSGSGQYTSYSGTSFNSCMNMGSTTYSGLTSSDKITFRRLNGYWVILVNDIAIKTGSYNWTDSRRPHFYTNIHSGSTGRVQHLKEIKYKEITTYSLSITAPSLAIPSTTIHITGTLTDDKNNPLKNKAVNLLVDNVLVDTGMTDENGIVPFEYTPSSIGEVILKLTHTNTNTIRSCELSHSVVISKLNLSTNKSTISYNTGETAILTATCTDGNGQTISLYDNATDTFIANMTDMGDGTYTYQYQATGHGDVTLRAEYDNNSSSVTIEDCLYYNTEEKTETRTNSYSVKSAIITNIVSNTEDYIFEFDLKGYNRGGSLNIGANEKYTPNSNTADYRIGIGFDYVSSRLTYYANNRTTSSEATHNDIGYPSSQTYYHFKLIKNGSTFTFYVDDILLATKTISWITNYNQYDIYPLLWTGSSSSITWKNIKFKLI